MLLFSLSSFFILTTFLFASLCVVTSVLEWVHLIAQLGLSWVLILKKFFYWVLLSAGYCVGKVFLTQRHFLSHVNFFMPIQDIYLFLSDWLRFIIELWVGYLLVTAAIIPWFGLLVTYVSLWIQEPHKFG